jgi:chromosome segregation ATPase
MDQRTTHSLKSVDSVAPAEIASMLGAAQERAREQRVAVESLLAEAKSLEERLELEALQARAAAARALAQEHASAAVKAAQLERQAIARVEACEMRLADLTRQRTAAEIAYDGARSARESAEKVVAECEARLADARTTIVRATETGNQAESKRAELEIAQAEAEAEARMAAQELAEHRTARQRADSVSNAHRALALRTSDEGDYLPSLDNVEELRRLEASIGLRAEAAMRAAERRAADAARNHVAG